MMVCKLSLRKVSFITLFLLISIFSYSQNVAQVVPKKKGMVGIQLYEMDNKFFVGKVFKGSPADRAGFANGDNLVSVAGKSLEGLQLQEVLALFDGDPGQLVNVKVKRNNADVDLNVDRVSPENLYQDSADFQDVLAEGQKVTVQNTNNPAEVQQSQNPNPSMDNETLSEIFSKNYGFKGSLIDQEFAQKLGTFINEGYLIVWIDPASQANTELKKWDLITKINGIPITQYLTNMKINANVDPKILQEMKLTVMSVFGEKEVIAKVKK